MWVAQTALPYTAVCTIFLTSATNIIDVVAAHTNSHLHAWSVELTHPATKEEVLDAFQAAPRIAFLRAGEGVVALNSTIKTMSNLNCSRSDMWEVGVWEDSITVKGNELFYNYQVYNQAIVVPETIDAIQALTGIEKDGLKSIAQTDKTMGLVRDFLV